MRVVQLNGDRAVIELGGDELLILNNALNEVCNALDTSEFSTRMGAELNEVRALLREIHEALSSVEEAQ